LALSSLFLFYRYRAHRDLHSFPTRRSSDLVPWQPMSVRPRCLHCASPFPATWWPATTRRCELETFADVVRARAGDPAVGLLFEGRSWTWGEVVREGADRAAALAATVPVPEGRQVHVGVLLDNVPDFV